MTFDQELEEISNETSQETVARKSIKMGRMLSRSQAERLVQVSNGWNATKRDHVMKIAKMPAGAKAPSTPRQLSLFQLLNLQ